MFGVLNLLIAYNILQPKLIVHQKKRINTPFVKKTLQSCRKPIYYSSCTRIYNAKLSCIGFTVKTNMD